MLAKRQDQQDSLDKTPKLPPCSLVPNGDLGQVRTATVSQARRDEQERKYKKDQQKDISTQDYMEIEILNYREGTLVVNDSQNTQQIRDSSLKEQK